MKSTLGATTLLSWLLFAQAAHTQSIGTESAEPKTSATTAVTVAWKTGVYTRYFAGGDGLVLANEPVAQSELKINWNRNLFSASFRLDFSRGFKSGWGSYTDEVDLGTEVVYSGPLNLTVGYAHLYLVPSAGSNVQYVEIQLSKRLKVRSRDVLTPSVQYYYFWPTSHAGPRAGTLVNSGLVYTHTLRSWLDVNHEVRFIRDVNGPFGLRPRTNIYSYEGSVNISVGHGWMLTPKIDYGGAFNDADRPGKLTLGFEVLKTFPLHGAQ
jgi:hypothetical protein